MLSLATQSNATPLPSVPEAYGVRLPPPSECLTAVDFDLLPNRPPPGVQLFDEEIEEVEESESDDDMEPALPPPTHPHARGPPPPAHAHPHVQIAHALPPAHTPSDVDMLTPGVGPGELEAEGEEAEGSEMDDDDGLFAGGDEEEEESEGEAMEDVTATTAANGMKRKLVEEDDYD